MAKPNKNLEDQQLYETFIPDGDNLVAGKYGMGINFYPINADRFAIVTKPSFGWKYWAVRVLIIAIGAALLILAKVVSFIYKYNTATEKDEEIQIGVDGYEFFYILILLILSLILWGIGSRWKSRKDKLIDLIKNYFKDLGDV